MKHSWWKRTCALAVLAALGTVALADTGKTKPAAQPKATTAASGAEQPATTEGKPTDPFESMKFRNLGPAAGGGRVAAVTGVPGQPNVYYIGAAGGGVWKTTDGGLNWKPAFEKLPTASIGAITVAPSNTNVVWVGTGESNPRNDVVTGKGVFMSPDGGLTWKAMGLENAGAISQIIVHPTNPDVVYVGVLGHVWGHNADRGVFRTNDGGKTWQKVLYVDEKTGVSDLVMDHSNPLVLFAAMWEMERFPWILISGGEKSAIYRSNDAGSTWTKLAEGLPKGPLGRIGLAIAPSNPNHVYALIQAKQGQLWDSNDLGEHWKLVSNDKRLIYRGFYFTTLYVSPENENHLYFLSFSILESVDGGKTAQVIGRNVHPDHHSLWIDPKNPERMINGNDGGVYISQDAGKNWRFLDNLPIEQFYMVATDDERPYLVCGGLQDNNGWCGPSNNLQRAGVTGAEWWTATGGDGEYVVPAGHKSNIIYAESQNGAVQRLDSRTGASDGIRPFLHGVTDMAPSDLTYRFNWTTPLAVSPADPKTVFLGGNVLFKSSDAGQSWTAISPDLTRNDKSKQQSSGGPVDLDLSGAETFDTILSLAISAIDQKVIWAGTDDGLVQLTRDGGQHWSNVTPANVPEFGRLQQIEVSPFDPATAYIALDYHELDNNKPYVFKTHDFGKTWMAINRGLPENDPARVLRENPNKKGMLVLGTDTGLFYSTDEGEHWTAIKSNFPVAPIYDLKFVKSSHDLLVATHGRGLFALDDLTTAEEFTPELAAKPLHLFSSVPAVRWRTANRRSAKPGDFVAPNPPAGATIVYHLAQDVASDRKDKDGADADGSAATQESGNARRQRGPVKIVITDANGQTVRTLYGPGKKGFNRVVWNLRYDEPTRFEPPRTAAEAALRAEQERVEVEYMDTSGGPSVVPGTYKVTVTVNGLATEQAVAVESDPRLPFDMDVAQKQLRVSLETREWVGALNQALNRVEGLKAQLATMQKVLAPEGDAALANAAYGSVVERSRALQRKLNGLEDKIYSREMANDSAGRLHFLARFQDRLQRVYRAVIQPYNQAPNAVVQNELDYCRKQVDAYLGEVNALLNTDVPAFNKLAGEKGTATLFAGTPITVTNTTESSTAAGK